MLGLITRVYRLIGDDSGDPEFSADEVQEALDRYQIRHTQTCLAGVPVIESGTLSFYEFRAAVGEWESTAVLYDNVFNVIDDGDYTEDPQQGVWTFTVGLTTPYVYATGKSYDVYGAAADLSEAWASKLARKTDMADAQMSLKRSQMSASLREQAARFRAQQRPRGARQVRSDVR